MKVILDIVCGTCGGTGLYCGFCEKPGTAVICLVCNGSGCVKLSYEPFVSRKEKSGVKTVQRSKGNFIATGVGGYGNSISYEEFKKGKTPT